MEEGGDKSITIKKSDLWKYSTFVLILVILVGGFFAFRGDSGSGGTAAVTDTGAGNQAPINAKALIESNDPVLGDKSAEISIIEFSDFQCPFCGKAFSRAITDLKTKFTSPFLK